MKICVVADTHFGCKGDSVVLLDYFKRFFDSVFFPYLDEHGIDTVIHLGDLVDKRKVINVYTAKRMREDFLDRLVGRDVHILVGNHDAFYRNTLDVNVLAEVGVVGKFNIYTQPTEIELGGLKMLLLPWICEDNEKQSLAMIEATRAPVCFGHLQIKGVEQNVGSYCQDGQDREVYSKFDCVISGHFHHKSAFQNIAYTGAPYEMSWIDWHDPKGFHIFDTATRELEFVHNPHRLFNKVFYHDDRGETFDEVMNSTDFARLKDTMVKVIVQSKQNPYWYDQFMGKLENLPCASIQSIEDHLNLHLEPDTAIVDQAESTLEILTKNLKRAGISPEYEKELENLFEELYHEANLLQA